MAWVDLFSGCTSYMWFAMYDVGHDQAYNVHNVLQYNNTLAHRNIMQYAHMQSIIRNNHKSYGPCPLAHSAVIPGMGTVITIVNKSITIHPIIVSLPLICVWVFLLMCRVDNNY